MNAPDLIDSSGAEFVSAPEPAPEPDSARPWWLTLRDGVVILLASWLAVLTATAEAFFTPFRLFGTLVPVSLLAAVLITPLLIRVSFRITGRRGLSLIPAGLWMVTAIFWAQGTSEGDVVLADGNWVAMAYLLVGSGAAAFGAYRVVVT